MASQEFLASFAVEIDEGGVTRLQSILEQNRELADSLAAAFNAASAAIHAFAEELGFLPGLGGESGITEEGFSGLSGLTLGLDTEEAKKDLQSFIALAKKPIPLSANASGMVSTARSAFNQIKSIFSTPVALKVNIERGTDDLSDDLGGGGDGPTPAKMSAGGRFSRPTDVQVAEDGDAEYIIPVKKEDRAVPLVRQMLSELSPAARESLNLSDDNGRVTALSGGLSAGNASTVSVSQDNRSVSAPVNIQVHASGVSAEQIGERLYDTAERYLLRTIEQASVLQHG